MIGSKLGLRGLLAPIATTFLVSFLASSQPLPLAAEEPAAAAGGADRSLPPVQCVVQLREARIAEMDGDREEALRRLRATVEACPDELTPIYALLDYYRLERRWRTEYQQLLRLLGQRVAEGSVELTPAILHRLVEDSTLPDQELRPVLTALESELSAAGADVDPDRLRVLVQMQQRLGEVEAAATTLEKLWRKTGSADLVWPLYRLYAELERWEDAARLLAPRTESDAAKGSAVRGVAYRWAYVHALSKLGRYRELSEEIEKLKRSIEGDEGLELVPDSYLGLLESAAWNLRDRGQDAEAEKLFRQAAELAPDDPGLQKVLLHLYGTEEERRRQAAEVAERWQEESDPHTLFEEGTQRLTAGDATSALELLRRAAPGLPKLEAAWYNLGLAAYRLEEWATVDEALTHAAELRPDRAQTHLYRAIALEKLERYGEAVPVFERTLELDPDNALVHYHLYFCHQKLGNLEQAKEALDRYRALEQQ
jgi:tetratricopeptide (TPR) repeat protein